MLLYGKPIADEMKVDQRRRIVASGITPKLVAIQAGDDLASSTYIKMKQRYGADIGAEVTHERTSGQVDELLALIQHLNGDVGVHGILLQLPLPDRSSTSQAVAAIDPGKDIDGLGPQSRFHSATAEAVLKLLEGNRITLSDRQVVLVGRGQLVGRPLAGLLQGHVGELVVCDQHTPQLAAKTRAADVLISATGAGHIIHRDMVKEGAVVVDVGTGEEEGSLVGDIDPELQRDDSLWVTPAEGGVGPLTVSVLFEHLLGAAGL